MWFSDYFNWWYSGENKEENDQKENKEENIRKVIIVEQDELEKKINKLRHVENDIESKVKSELKIDHEKSEFSRVFESRKKRQEKTGEKLMVLDDWSVKYLNS
jgi:hypothetical protein